MKKTIAERFFRLSLALVLSLAELVFPTPAHAAGVVSVCDEASLLAAISGGGVVKFSCDGTITFTNQITLEGAIGLSLDGVGHQITLNGGGRTRLFMVGPETPLNLQNLTLKNGYIASPYPASPSGGGAIFNNGGQLQIVNVKFISNLARFDLAYGGAIYNYNGTVTIESSTFINNSTLGDFTTGGAIYSYGPLYIMNSTFTGNSAIGGSGGAIATEGAIIGPDYALITGSTFTANLAKTVGGALFFTTSGEISNNTFVGNYVYDPVRSFGGAIANGGAITTISNSTFLKNSAQTQGGSIYNTAYITLRDNIIADSLAGGNCATSDVSLVITDGGGNLQWNSLDPNDHSCPGVSGDPKLGPLGSYGGPTQTLRLLPGSAAINLAKTGCPPSDQRGYARPAPVCDSGAFELSQVFLPLAVQSAGQ